MSEPTEHVAPPFSAYVRGALGLLLATLSAFGLGESSTWVYPPIGALTYSAAFLAALAVLCSRYSLLWKQAEPNSATRFALDSGPILFAFLSADVVLRQTRPLSADGIELAVLAAWLLRGWFPR